MPKINHFTRKQLKTKNASDFKHGDMVLTGNYVIHIKYKGNGKTHKSPSLHSYVEHRYTFKMLDCTPGVRGARPYYIDDFLHR